MITTPNGGAKSRYQTHRCHELRIVDERVSWRIVYRVDPDAVAILEVFEKKTNRTPVQVIEVCRKRLKDYES